MENTSSHNHSENAQHLIDSSAREAEEQLNFVSDSQRKCTHCGNVADHRPKTSKCPASTRLFFYWMLLHTLTLTVTYSILLTVPHIYFTYT